MSNSELVVDVVVVATVVVAVVVIAVVVIAAAVVVVAVEYAEKKVLFHPTMGDVILRLGTLPEPWESENTSEELRRS